MSARLSLSALPAHSEPALSPSPSPTPELEREPEHEVDAVPASRSARKARSWVDPALLPPHAHPTPIGGSAPEWVKELNYNTLMHYGVGPQDAFGARVGRALRFVDVSVQRRGDGSVQRGGDGSVQRRGDGSVQRRENVSVQRRGSGERMEATTIAEVGVTKHMLNGAGMLHGGCVAYLIDNCCSTPLVVLGLSTGTNGVGVTQALNILFHAPAPLGTTLQIVSTSIALGGRVMSARCEILDKGSGRTIASAFLTKMQPAKL